MIIDNDSVAVDDIPFDDKVAEIDFNIENVDPTKHDNFSNQLNLIEIQKDVTLTIVRSLVFL